jgi:hypothetical protein
MSPSSPPVTPYTSISKLPVPTPSPELASAESASAQSPIHERKVVLCARANHFKAVRLSIEEDWDDVPEEDYVDPPLVGRATDIITWDLVKQIMKAYGLKETGMEDVDERYSGLRADKERADEEFFRDRFVGGVKVWWRRDDETSTEYVYPGVMKRVTIDEAILYCWPMKTSIELLQSMRRNGIRHIEVVHFFSSSSGPLICRQRRAISEPVFDYTNVITTNFETVREKLVVHLHRVVPRKQLDEAECCYCASPINWMCKACGEGVPVCINKAECLNAHWREIVEDEERHPRYHAHDAFAMQLFADEYVASKKADVYIVTNKYACSPRKRRK